MTLKFKITLLVATLLTGCNTHEKSYNIQSTPFESEAKAVVSFLKVNKETLGKLTPDQEILGWVVKCKGEYYHTTAKVGTTSNVINSNQVNNIDSCVVTANIHSHLSSKGMTSDFFSPADLRASEEWTMYMLAQENCNLRVTNGKGRKGKLLGKIENCNG